MSEGWTWEEDSEHSTVSLSGEVDFSSSQEVRQLFMEFIEQTPGPLSVDLSGLAYLDSSGLAVLLDVRRRLKEKGRDLILRQMTPAVEKIFRLTQVARLFGL